MKGRNLSRCKMEVPRLSGDKPARGCFILWNEKSWARTGFVIPRVFVALENPALRGADFGGTD